MPPAPHLRGHMPSPIGHALAGVAAGCLVGGGSSVAALGIGQFRAGLGRIKELWLSREVLGFWLLGVLPDVDFLFGSHSTFTHSLGAVVGVGCVATMVPGSSRVRFAAAAAAAYGSHVLLDWLGTDTTAPFGVMALWPFSDAFFLSDHHWFFSVCRQFGEARCWQHNTEGVLWEIVTLAPLAIAVSWLVVAVNRR